MKHFLMPLCYLLLINDLFSCENVTITLPHKLTFTACYYKENQLYLSQKCPSINDCFILPVKNTIKLKPNQSPLFSKCYQMRGKPYFGTPSNTGSTQGFCTKDDVIVDLENLYIARP